MIVYVDTSKIRPGRLEDVKAAMSDLARFVDDNEPQLIAGFARIDDRLPAG